METWTTSVNKLLSRSDCVLIPRYQRRFSWDIQTAHKLIRDIAEVSTKQNAEQEKHWIGAVIYRELPKSQKCTHGRDDHQHTCREIIDGQQRLTTIRLWTLALLHHAESVGESLTYELTDMWLQKPNDSEMNSIVQKEDVFERKDSVSTVYSYFRYLLWLGQDAILEPDAVKPPRRGIKGDTHQEKWLRYIEFPQKSGDQIQRSAPVDSASLLAASLNDLSVLGIQLTTEDPVEVFEALNGNRTTLGQFDHLRNFAFSRLEITRRDRIYDDSWTLAEALFDDVPVQTSLNTNKLMDIFLYEYLISLGEGKFGKTNASSSFSSFLRLSRSKRFNQFGSIEDWITNRLEIEIKIWKAQRSHQHMKIQHKNNVLDLPIATKRTLQRIRVASDGPPAPLVMLILRCGLLPIDDPRRFTTEQVQFLLKRLEGFLFKTLLAEKSLTNFRAEVTRAMFSLNEGIALSEAGTAWEVVNRQLEEWNIENWKDLRLNIEGWHRRQTACGLYDNLKPGPTLALLDVLDEELGSPRSSGFLRKPNEETEDPYWVEHIYPQSDKKWISDLREWSVEPSQMKRLVHSLGNLTALEKTINSEIKNRNFQSKKEALSQASMVPTKLNDWMENSRWTPQDIEDRNHHLLMVLSERWPD
jgi:hypothetical protein